MKEKSDYQKSKLPKLSRGRIHLDAYGKDLREKQMKRNPKIQKHKSIIKK